MTARTLRRLREWLTLKEAADELSEDLGERVSIADVLRLAIDGHLRLSLYLPAPLRGLCQRIGDEGLDPEETVQSLEGLCDVAMFGRTKRQVEHDCQFLLQNFVPIEGKRLGAHVEKGDFLCRLPPDEGGGSMSSRAASEFPQGSVICIRRETLEAFARQNATNQAPSQAALVTTQPDSAHELGTRERATLLTIIAALATEADIDISKASKAGSVIANIISQLGVEVAPNTVARHLRNIEKTMPELLRQRPE